MFWLAVCAPVRVGQLHDGATEVVRRCALDLGVHRHVDRVEVAVDRDDVWRADLGVRVGDRHVPGHGAVGLHGDDLVVGGHDDVPVRREDGIAQFRHGAVAGEVRVELGHDPADVRRR